MFAELFVGTSCHACDKAKKLLISKGIDYSITNISDKEEKANLELRINKSIRTVPQIIINNKYIGDFNDLKNYLDKL